MKAEDAVVILAGIEDIYSQTIEEDRDVWLLALQGCDAEAASDLVFNQWSNGRGLPRNFPDLTVVTKAIEIQRALLDRPPRPAEPPPVPQLSPLIPLNPALPPRWVRLWELARKKGDERVFPEQEIGFRDNGYTWPPAAGLIPDERRAELERELEALDHWNEHGGDC